MDQKQCFKCLTVLPLTEFYAHPRMADGHLGKCKGCTKKDATAHRDKNLEKIRAYDRSRERRAKPETEARWRANGGAKKVAAHRAVKRALARGYMTKKPCEVCGATERIEAHHDDYEKRLEIRWLCAKHHRQHHAGRRID